MKLRRLTAFVFLTLFLASCQQEVDDEILPDPGSGGGNGGGGGVPGTSRIIKAVGVTGQDTLTTYYTYDAQGRMVSFTTDGDNNGFAVHIFKKWYYQGDRIVKVATLSTSPGIPIDTGFTEIHYPNATTLEYDYTVNRISLMGFESVDSSRYSFTNGQLRTVTSYLTALGMPTYLASRATYTYNASGNAIGLRTEGTDDFTGATPLELMSNEIMTYGESWGELWTVPNPAQRYLINGLPNQGNEAMIKTVTTMATGDVASITSTYSSGAGSRPTSGVITQNVSGQVIVTKYSFYYQ